LRDLVISERKILTQVLKKNGARVWIGLIWFRTETSGGLLWTRKLTFGFQKRR
jgi:hypothetical protein